MLRSLSSLQPHAIRWRVITIGLALSAGLLAGGTAQAFVDRYIYGPPEGWAIGFDSAFEAWCGRLFIILNAPPVLFLFAVGAAITHLFGLSSAVRPAVAYTALFVALVLWWYLISGPIAAALVRRLAGTPRDSSIPGRPP